MLYCEHVRICGSPGWATASPGSTHGSRLTPAGHAQPRPCSRPSSIVTRRCSGRRESSTSAGSSASGRVPPLGFAGSGSSNPAFVIPASATRCPSSATSISSVSATSRVFVSLKQTRTRTNCSKRPLGRMGFGWRTRKRRKRKSKKKRMLQQRKHPLIWKRR